MAELTPAQQLHALLSPTTDEGQRAISEDASGVLKTQSERYQKALAEESPDQLKLTLGDITRKLTDAGHLDKNITADRVVDTFDFRPFEARRSVPAEETAAPIAPGLKEFLPKESAGDGGVTTIQEHAQTKLKDVQKKATIEAFKSLLDQYKDSDELPNKIDEFYRTHLSAAGVLGSQYQILLAQARKLYGKSDEFDKHEDALKKEASESVEKLQAIHQIGPLQDPKDQEQREVELNHLEKFKSQGADREALIKSASDIFDEQWEKRQLNTVLGRFARELRDMNFSYQAIIDGVDTIAATTIQATPQEEAQPEEPVPQGAPPEQGRGKGKAGQFVRGAEKKVAQAGKKELERLGKAGAERAVQAAGTAAVEETAGATIEVWGPPVAIGCAVILVAIIVAAAIAVLLYFFFHSSTGNTPAILPKSCDPSITCVADLKAMGITLQGDLAYNRDPYGKAKVIYDTLSFITQPPSKYGTLLGIPGKPITIDLQPGGCAGHASTNGLVKLYGFESCGNDVAKFMLIHEVGHEIAFRNPNLYNKFYSQFPIPLLIFYKLPTYNCELDYGPGGPYPGECFADMLGEYVLYKTYRDTVSGLPIYFEHNFSSFPTAFAPFYNFAKDNIFMGLQF